MAALRELGVELALATGDQRQTAQAIAAQLGIDQVHAELSPEAKAELVNSWRK